MDVSINDPHRRGMPQTKKEYKEYEEESGARIQEPGDVAAGICQAQSLLPT
jgi:hypothetical protein